MVRIAILQMTSGIDPDVNCQTILQAAHDASKGGAQMLFTPEMSVLIDRNRKRAAKNIRSQKETSYPAMLGEAARNHNVWLTAGAPVQLGNEMLANRQWVFAPDDRAMTYYDKIHMFDVELDSGETWRESAAYTPGNDVVTIADTPIGLLGLTTCYDVRFPALFEALGNRRCDAITVPAAFTVPTGNAHWHIMLRARAIEASAFIIAPAQVGKHQDGRETYGHSLVIDPWGKVLLDMGRTESGLGFCDIDLRRIAEVRSQIPSLANRRKIAT